ncbi:MAG TPA: hypothetical protein VE931_03485 [Pyrinomonadaceae bacterium]|nr:hypothetical protein [Pyrinomonadaceae bacterium]
MRKNNCKLIRRELDELMLGEAWSAAATEHLRECAECREFHVQQTKLRQIVGSLGTVEAPADFDFRLRARLASDSSSAPAIYWRLMRAGLVVAAMAIVVLMGVAVVRDAMRLGENKGEVAQKPQQPQVHQPVNSDQAPPVFEEPKQSDHVVAGVTRETIRKIRPAQTDYKKRPLSSFAISSTGASVLNGTTPAGVSAAFPIEASAQPFTISLEDGRGNAKTISVPTVSFGSQRIVQGGNQFAPKRDW